MNEEVVLRALTQLQHTVSEGQQDIREEIATLRRDTMSHFDAMYKRFDRLETEFQALKQDSSVWSRDLLRSSSASGESKIV